MLSGSVSVPYCRGCWWPWHLCRLLLGRGFALHRWAQLVEITGGDLVEHCCCWVGTCELILGFMCYVLIVIHLSGSENFTGTKLFINV